MRKTRNDKILNIPSNQQRIFQEFEHKNDPPPTMAKYLQKALHSHVAVICTISNPIYRKPCILMWQ